MKWSDDICYLYISSLLEREREWMICWVCAVLLCLNHVNICLISSFFFLFLFIIIVWITKCFWLLLKYRRVFRSTTSQLWIIRKTQVQDSIAVPNHGTSMWKLYPWNTCFPTALDLHCSENGSVCFPRKYENCARPYTSVG